MFGRCACHPRAAAPRRCTCSGDAIGSRGLMRLVDRTVADLDPASYGAGDLTVEYAGDVVVSARAVFEVDDWDDAIEDPSRTLLERREQLDLLHRWLISYWSRLGTIAFMPGHDDVVRPGRIGPALLGAADRAAQSGRFC